MPPINKLSLQKNSTSIIHEHCYANTYMDHVLGVNVDIQNPSISDLLADSFMNQPVGWFAKKISQICRLLIGFGIKYVVNTAIRYKKCGPCLKRITRFCSKLPDDKFDITTTLLENLNSEVKEKGSIHHFPNHFNK